MPVAWLCAFKSWGNKMGNKDGRYMLLETDEYA